jgi:non-heme chloroperoxidase
MSFLPVGTENSTPIELYPNTGRRLPGLIRDMELIVINDGPHAIAWSHADQVNTALVQFLGAPAPAPVA